jgi:hypothetical protein
MNHISKVHHKFYQNYSDLHIITIVLYKFQINCMSITSSMEKDKLIKQINPREQDKPKSHSSSIQCLWNFNHNSNIS